MNDLLFRAFSEPTRRRALRLLTSGPLCVCDITAALRLPQPTVSRHLGALQRAGLVSAVKRGKWRHYGLESSRGVARALLATLKAEGDSHGDNARLRAINRRNCA
ncbi:MAG: metalloregulator ArsR/SmtB family transcription factor [Elusimicrobiota bacterium]|nr:MAG: metalloregulator ArsR/SmtB family transcription factor [Elusimicrobiota bacterium]